VLPHWLAILSWFPETTPPHTYQQLLPAISMQGTLIPWLRQVTQPHGPLVGFGSSQYHFVADPDAACHFDAVRILLVT
jgi:hypothetical protein